MEFCQQHEGGGGVTGRVDEQWACLPLFGGEANGVYNGNDLGFEGLGLVDLDGDGADFFYGSVGECFDLRSLLGCEGVGEV